MIAQASEDDFFAQYLGKNSFNFNTTAELLKEVDHLHSSHLKGSEDEVDKIWCLVTKNLTSSLDR